MGRLAVGLSGWGKTDEDSESQRAMHFTGTINGRKRWWKGRKEQSKQRKKGQKGPGLLHHEVGIVFRRELNKSQCSKTTPKIVVQMVTSIMRCSLFTSMIYLHLVTKQKL